MGLLTRVSQRTRVRTSNGAWKRQLRTRMHKYITGNALIPDTLDDKAQKVRHDLRMAAVMPIADQTAGSPAGASHHMQLELVHCLIIRILRKGIAIFKENRYHSLVIHVRA